RGRVSVGGFGLDYLRRGLPERREGPELPEAAHQLRQARQRPDSGQLLRDDGRH
nr:hypothetical protein [Tanacetum cinerariifolium]